MNWLKQKKPNEEVSYWQTIADALAALLMILLLLVMLLILYIVRTPDEELVDPYVGAHLQPNDKVGISNGKWTEPTETQPYRDYYHYNYYNVGGGGGGGGDDHTEPTETTQPTEEWRGEGDGMDKAAVMVMLVDEETERTIKEADIRFELYDSDDALETLRTYYPHKIEYDHYDTVADGFFYFPEKLAMGTHKLHEVNAPYGYDIAKDQYFRIEEACDWPEPYVVKVMLSPAKNYIRVQLRDQASGAGLAGGSYDVIAAEDIITADGTLRYEKGLVVCTIECDGSGYGESPELYLGKYLLQQRDVPMYYAKDLEPHAIAVERKVIGAKPPEHKLTNVRTAVTLTLTDELYENQPIPNAAFQLSQDGAPGVRVTMTTDRSGRITMNELVKDASYTLRQETSGEGYLMTSEVIRFRVSEDGRVQGAERFQYEMTNRMLRVSIAARSKLLRNMVSDYNVTLYDSSNVVVETWDSSGVEHVVEGLRPGKYFLYINGRENTQTQITIQDKADIQSFSCAVWTLTDFWMLAALAVFAILLAILLTVTISRKRSRKLSKKGEVTHHETE